MNKPHLRTVVAVACLLVGAGASTARADVCVAVDESQDMLSATERVAAVRLVSQEFERAGERLAPIPCADEYLLWHIQLGNTIVVTLSGSRGRREATAFGLDDLPPIYNQMVRSLMTGEPMTLGGVVNRGNVAISQTSKPRVESESIFYARLGYGAIFANETHGVPSVNLIGYRHELDAFAIDASFLAFGFSTSGGGGYTGASSVSAGTWLKLEALRFFRPLANNSAYAGGGLSWGGASLVDGGFNFEGSGLQGEFTAGYEMDRASTIRVFVQTDATFPFYKLTSSAYFYGPPEAQPSQITSHRYAPSLTISLGLGWQHGGHTQR